MQRHKVQNELQGQFFLAIFSGVSTLSCNTSHAKNVHLGSLIALQMDEADILVIGIVIHKLMPPSTFHWLSIST
jgi:hypothetical protein